MIVAAFVSFFSFWLLMRYIPRDVMRVIVGHAWVIDIPLHVGILWMFLGTSTNGLLQAEAAGILFSLYLRWYRKAYGYKRLTLKGWKQGDGWLRATPCH